LNDLVSVIMPAYNSEKYIRESIESVISQDYKNWELVIVDDCSKDGTKRIVKEYMKKDTRIKLIELKKNLGVANARNTAIRESKGKYIAFLDSDDLWHRCKLSKQISFMRENKYTFTFSNYELISDEGKLLDKKINAPNKVNYKRVLKGNPIGCLTVVIDRENIGKIHMPSIRHEDYATWLEILRNNVIAHNVGECLALYRKTNKSLSSNKFKAIVWTWNIYRKNQKLNLIRSTHSMFWYVINTLKKYL
jgi:teichuronic acid biosynthesis glycosyltransferase TuaG